jgi:hypothetical protein
MFPIPHLVLFVPFCVFAALFVTSVAVSCIIRFATRRHPQQQSVWAASASRPAAPRQEAEIIYFRPRKTSLTSSLGISASHRAVHH